MGKLDKWALSLKYPAKAILYYKKRIVYKMVPRETLMKMVKTNPNFFEAAEKASEAELSQDFMNLAMKYTTLLKHYCPERYTGGLPIEFLRP